jgi:hypothetical protein
MTNSYENAIVGLYTGIFADIRQALPTVRGLGRDESRLLYSVQTRGLRFLTIDMPAFGKHFDRCLDEGRLTPSNLPNFGVRKGGTSPRFLEGLFLRVFAPDGLLLSQPCVTSIFLIRQLCYSVKKIKMDCTEKVRENTLKRYSSQEQSLRPPSLSWYGGRFDAGLSGSLHIDDFRHGLCGQLPELFELGEPSASFCDTVHNVADRISTGLGFFHPSDWRPKHGPGAVADAKGGKFKYDFPTWSERLESVFHYSELGFSSYDSWTHAVLTGKVANDSEVPSKVLTVPKSQKAPRIIAKEPTANMWCQQIVRDFLERSVMRTPIRHSIHFKDQTFNGRAALSASKTQSHWTVDLSDASDRVTLWLVERLFRRNHSLLRALQASRSTVCLVPLKGGSEHLLMKKFAPQGSATTFPVQTIIFAILAVSAVIHVRGWKVDAKTIARASKEVLVFGDDTLIPEDAGRQYVEILTYCGLTVNYSKTYGTGKFRESCGVEAYDGADVTPAYFTSPYRESDTSSVASTVECSNNFFMKGLWHAAAALESTLDPWHRKMLRVSGPGDGRFGLTSFCGSTDSHLVRRYNKELHRDEVRALTVISVVSRTQPGGVGHYLQYFTEAPTQDIQWMSGVDGRPSVRVTQRWEPTH